MTDGELDRMLSSDEVLEPTAGFTRRVMAAVHREEAEPRSRSFPWLRFGVGISASAVMAAAGTALMMPLADAAALSPFSAIASELSLAAAAMLVGLGTAAIPRVLARR